MKPTRKVILLYPRGLGQFIIQRDPEIVGNL
jgi:hypothetical protein